MKTIKELCDMVRETAYAIHTYHGHGHLEKALLFFRDLWCLPLRQISMKLMVEKSWNGAPELRRK